MSAFVLPDDFFQQLATELACRSVFDRNSKFRYSIDRFAPIGHYSEASEDSIQTRVSNLQKANYKAVNQRYNENEKPKKLLFHLPIFSKWSDVQFIKNLQCLRYQMSEGTVYNSKIYKELDAFIGSLCENMLDALPEYENANWGS